TGVRVGRAIQVLIAANAGRDDVLAAALRAHAAALAATPPDPDWRLLDTYATAGSPHQADPLWTAPRGPRPERFARAPRGAPASEPTGPDPVGADPFGADPVGAVPSGDRATTPAKETP